MEGRIVPAGDSALVIEFGDTIEEQINRKVLRMEREIRKENLAGILDLVPTFRSLMVLYDPGKQSFRRLKKRFEKIDVSESDRETYPQRTWIIPCCYGGEFGPDLTDMEHLLNMSAEEIIQLHCGTDYLIYMLGFLPGFVYLGGMPQQIQVPRLESPRTVIPARSVGIGGAQTGVYPLESPGGWRLIGRTPLEFYDPSRKPEILCHAGEYIRFVPVSRHSYDAIREDVKQGIYQTVCISG